MINQIIFMAFKTMEDINGTGIQGIMQTAAEAVPILPGLILGALFIILAFTSYFSAMRRFGKGDLPASASVAGFVTVIVALLFSLIPNFITNVTIVPVIILEILFVIWLYFSKE
ncbi:hypothetical protein LCGC14_2735070 [marine sediment metagenome]|uniref:Uncharacterized protein n=1 Tax=marine sediment metagenome TaxID=412755 RepID=A0A0F8Z661_9ZZZZ